MLDRLSIRNYKSIEDVDMGCSRVNLFIGKPNTGKSNILETLGILSWMDGEKVPLEKIIRMNSPQNIFRNEETSNPIRIQFSINHRNYALFLVSERDRIKADLDFAGEGMIPIGGILHSGSFYINNKDANVLRNDFFNIKFYRFERKDKFPGVSTDYLSPPDGPNLFSLITSRKEFKERMRSFFKPYGIEVVFKLQDRTFEVFTREGDNVFSHPYISVSDTFQRMIFYLMAIESNTNSTLIFEEPEIHSFPSYVKMLAQIIAEDSANQYFISTHNPYLFGTLLEKMNENEITVNVVSYIDNKTSIRQVHKDEYSSLLDFDPFFNIDKLASG